MSLSPSSTLPQGMTLRAPTRDDLPAIFDLIRTSDLDLFGQPDWTMQSLEHQWSHPKFDPATDAWLIFASDNILVGYAMATAVAPYRIFGIGVTHPSHYGQGIGATLLTLMEARAEEHVPLAPPEARVSLQIGTAGGDGRAARLLTAHGFEHVRSFNRMQIIMDEPPLEPVWPEGIRLRTLVPGQDEHALWELIEAAFADHWGHSPQPYEQWMQRQ